ncbi:hypothetical protein GJ689_07295 [Rhodoplanes serenus]|uniref:DUF1640 domain-containing protein n=1 Tax=Rhodoplanes serenus TaxID=200615 RepID=A0A9X4XKU3_9BRAD|nr:hypothetical protein [Rhodoplanes serenus]MTW16011.1 hypothetical protein [Rhodoplanes serenus]
MAFAFDTLGYAKRLQEAGVPVGQAEAHATAARDFIMAELVTKADLKATIDAAVARLDARIDAHSTRLDGRIDALAARTDARIDLLESKLDKLALQITVRLGAVIAASVAVLAALAKLS